MGIPTPNAGFTLPTIGGDAGPLWAEELNGNFVIADALLGGVNSLNVTGVPAVFLSPPQAANFIQQFTGTLTSNVAIVLPAIGRQYAIQNMTTGNFTLQVGCQGGGNTQIIPQGLSSFIWTDGTYVRVSNVPGWQELTTYTINGLSNFPVALPAPFRRFRVTLQNVTVTGGGAVAITMTCSNNGGSTFANSGYTFTGLTFTSNNQQNIGGSNGAAFVQISTTIGPASVWDATYEIWPGSGSGGAVIRGNGAGMTVAQNVYGSYNIAALANIANVNAINVAVSTGNFSGTIITEGLP